MLQCRRWRWCATTATSAKSMMLSRRPQWRRCCNRACGAPLVKPQLHLYSARQVATSLVLRWAATTTTVVLRWQQLTACCNGNDWRQCCGGDGAMAMAMLRDIHGNNDGIGMAATTTGQMLQWWWLGPTTLNTRSNGWLMSEITAPGLLDDVHSALTSGC